MPMGNQRKSSDSKSKQNIFDALKPRLPSSRSSKKCIGCFSPRNTLTVKPHTQVVLSKDEVKLNEENGRLSIKCVYCEEWRNLDLGSFSHDVIKADYPDFNHFTILKDHKETCKMERGCQCHVTIIGIPADFLTDEMWEYSNSVIADFEAIASDKF